jgi:hypothetical protein
MCWLVIPVISTLIVVLPIIAHEFHDCVRSKADEHKAFLRDAASTVSCFEADLTHLVSCGLRKLGNDPDLIAPWNSQARSLPFTMAKPSFRAGTIHGV